MRGLCFGSKRYNKKAQLSQIRCEEKTDAFLKLLGISGHCCGFMAVSRQNGCCWVFPSTAHSTGTASDLPALAAPAGSVAPGSCTCYKHVASSVVCPKLTTEPSLPASLAIEQINYPEVLM